MELYGERKFVTSWISGERHANIDCDAAALVTRCPVSEPVFLRACRGGVRRGEQRGSCTSAAGDSSSVQCQYDNTADIMAHNYTQHLSAAPRRAGSDAGAGR